MSPEGATKLLVLVGPTGVGKTDVAFEVARQLGGEIISADSRLVYRLMDIGTAKPDRSMRDRIAHHLIDIVDPDTQYTSKEYERDARAAVSAVLAREKVPVVVGGTGLYVRALLRGIFEGPGRDSAMRERLARVAEEKGKAYLWERLLRVDPEKARRTDPENLPRVIRALEVFESTGRPMSELELARIPLAMPVVKLGLKRAQQELHALIDQRVERMIDLGLVDEVKDLVRRGYGTSQVVRMTLGYREMLRYLGEELSLEQAVGLIKTNTRRFAKRQLTWFRRETDLVWLDVTGRISASDIASDVHRLYQKENPGGRPPGPPECP